jgi:hypothetical protein
MPAISPNDKKVMNVVPPFLLIIFLIAESSQAATAAAIEEAAEQADYRGGIYGTFWLLCYLRGVQ